jgi:transposase
LTDDTRRVAERAHQIERWWAEGVSRKEIAARLGWTDNHVSVEFARLRADGFDLPYRYKLSRPQHESQVAA